MQTQRRMQHERPQHFDFSAPMSLQPQQQMAQMVHPQPQKPDNDFDDSGIGMGLMDDDLTMAKFGLTGAHVGHDYVGGDLGIHAI